MYDLRSAIETRINEWITNDSPTYVDLCVSFKSTEDALDNLEKVVTQNAAVLIGDWITEPERWTYRHNKVRNYIELIIAARSHNAQNALDEIIRSVTYNCIDKQNYGQEETMDSFVEFTEEIKESGTMKYQILTVKVNAVETSPSPEIDIYPAYPIFVLPAEDNSFTVNNPYSSFGVRVKYSPIDKDVDYILLILRNSQLIVGSNEYSYVKKFSPVSGGDINHSFTLFHSDTQSGDYYCYAILFNKQGVGVMATRKISISKGL